MPIELSPQEPLQFPVLIGDIGGTNARFAIVVDANSEPKLFENVQTSDFATIEDAIQTGVLDHTSLLPRSIILAVAGPLKDGQVKLTNNNWIVSPLALGQYFDLNEVIVLNDFEAQALGVASLDASHFEQIGGQEGAPLGCRVIIGPGTGLGVSSLICWQNIWIPIPGEGGHVDMGPRTVRDFAIWPHLETVGGRISAEQILSGRGLVNLYRAIAKCDKMTPDLTTPEQISKAGLDKTDACAAQAIELFCTYLGRIAGDLAVTLMSHGGVYITGGIGQKLLSALKQGQLREAFEDKKPLKDFLEVMPVRVITHPQAALFGLSAFARMPSSFGISTQGRRWKA